MTRLHTWTRSDRGARPKTQAAIIVLCLTLLALLAFVQVAHVHSVNTDADHCSLCIVLHAAAAPVTAAVLVIVLVLFEAVVPAATIRPLGILWHSQFYIRPPPSLSTASF